MTVVIYSFKLFDLQIGIIRSQLMISIIRRICRICPFHHFCNLEFFSLIFIVFKIIDKNRIKVVKFVIERRVQIQEII